MKSEYVSMTPNHDILVTRDQYLAGRPYFRLRRLRNRRFGFRLQGIVRIGNGTTGKESLEHGQAGGITGADQPPVRIQLQLRPSLFALRLRSLASALARMDARPDLDGAQAAFEEQ
jgi:hypothetical protein